MNSRRALALDHFVRGRPMSIAGVAILAAALGVAALLALWQQRLVHELNALELERQAVRLASTDARVAPIAPSRLDDAARRAEQVALELRLPWTALFDAVEGAADASVALLTIEPDARRSALRVSGEARNKKAMLDYMNRLGAQPPMLRAVLESHQQREAAGSPVQFTLIATWDARR